MKNLIVLAVIALVSRPIANEKRAQNPEQVIPPSNIAGHF